MDHGYPRSVSSYWKGVPSNMEGVLLWHNGGIYVFKDTQNWFFSHSSQSIGVLSSYPKSIMQWWSNELELTGYTALRYDFPLNLKGEKQGWEQSPSPDVGRQAGKPAR